MKQYKADRVKVHDVIWQCFAKLGISKQLLAQHTHLPAAILLDQIPASTDQYFSIWDALSAISKDAFIGIEFAKTLELTTLPPSFFTAYLSKDYREALFRVARFKRLCAPEVIHIVENKDRCTIEFDWIYADKITPNALVDATFASLMELGRSATKANICAVSVALSREKQESQRLEEYFGCHVQFNSSKNSLVFKRSDLDRRFETYNQELSNLLIPPLDAELNSEQYKTHFSSQVKWIIKQQLSSGSPKINNVASELSVSNRTLQRRITHEGNTFKDLLIQVRREAAKKYLSDPQLDLHEIAVLLGYEDQNSFYRAFKLWEGDTPSIWRKNNKPEINQPFH